MSGMWLVVDLKNDVLGGKQNIQKRMLKKD